jgi:saccharopine dehydrogenase (NAD+, L-lysine forming)
LNQRATFGIVGGYGATGRAVVSELHKSSNGEIVIAGRDLTQAKALAAQFDNRVSAMRVDVMDRRALEEFCQTCSIVVNSAGPVMLLQDRVAQAAFCNHCHYIDAAGLSLVKERMVLHSREIADSGLTFVISAGWMPGLSEIVPAYSVEQARTRMDSVESVTVCFGDSGEWSRNAL